MERWGFGIGEMGVWDWSDGGLERWRDGVVEGFYTAFLFKGG